MKLEITSTPDDISDSKNGDRLLAVVEILGAEHHLELMRVVEDEEGTQKPENEDYQGSYDDLQVLYSAKRYQTFEVPGQPGRYIAFMHPFED